MRLASQQTKHTKTKVASTMASTHQPLLDSPNISRSISRRLVLSFAAILCSTALFLVSFNTSSKPLSFHNICNHAHDQESCLSLVKEIASNSAIKMDDPVNYLQTLLKNSTTQTLSSIEQASDIRHRVNVDPVEQAALVDCVELLELSMERIKSSIAVLETGAVTADHDSQADAHTWLSGVLTNYVTCLDGLTSTGGQAKSLMEARLHDLISRARTSLAMVVSIKPAKDYSLMMNPLLNRDFPSWVTMKDRKLLEAPALLRAVTANVVVAKDGSGKYTTVKDAVASAPDNGNTRYVIYVKKGTYNEHVEIGSAKKNVMLVGDGMDYTIITGSLNVVDGATTFNSATVAVVGDGFMAQDIWFQNTAGPQKHQAVALRVGGDKSVINRCRIDAYQDTLYTISNRQFYRDSYITGTVDFIFGNAAVVFQSCKLVPRKPMSGQGNMVTAQGRTDPNQNTGTSIQNCDIIASSDLVPVQGSIKSYLGRPWKEYSRTVVMQSNIGDLIDPTGWSIWTGDFALSTLYYGEYANKGAGAGTSKRVTWAGYHVITSATEAAKFTVAQLIQGGSWLQSTGVAYTEGL